MRFWPFFKIVAIIGGLVSATFRYVIPYVAPLQTFTLKPRFTLSSAKSSAEPTERKALLFGFKDCEVPWEALAPFMTTPGTSCARAAIWDRALVCLKRYSDFLYDVFGSSPDPKSLDTHAFILSTAALYLDYACALKYASSDPASVSAIRGAFSKAFSPLRSPPALISPVAENRAGGECDLRHLLVRRFWFTLEVDSFPQRNFFNDIFSSSSQSSSCETVHQAAVAAVFSWLLYDCSKIFGESSCGKDAVIEFRLMVVESLPYPDTDEAWKRPIWFSPLAARALGLSSKPSRRQ